MQIFKNLRIIGIDHGYGNIKTANTVTPTGVSVLKQSRHLKVTPFFMTDGITASAMDTSRSFRTKPRTKIFMPQRFSE